MARRTLLSSLLVVLMTGSSVAAEDHVTTIRWSALKAAGTLTSGEIVSAPSDARSPRDSELLVSNETGQPLVARLATLDAIDISKFQYRVHGTIRYEDVEQPGHLEMWNQFADGNRYFSRTLADHGPMAVIHGTSPGREFILPFQSSPASGAPTRLEINLVLPANGRVWIGPLHITQFNSSEWATSTTAAGSWWGNQTAGWIGGIVGSLLGIMGAIVGSLSSLGRGRSVAVGLCWFTIVFGVLCLIAGAIAVLSSQPYVVYFPLLLIGVLSTVIMSSVLPTTRKRFEAAELRRMKAMDIKPV